jgi:hypothetical protein
MSATALVFAYPLLLILGLLVASFLLYLVIRKGVRDGMLDARQLDREEAAARRARAAWQDQQTHDQQAQQHEQAQQAQQDRRAEQTQAAQPSPAQESPGA